MAAKEERVRIAVDIERSVKRKLDLLAAANQRRTAQEVRLAILDHLDKHAGPRR